MWSHLSMVTNWRTEMKQAGKLVSSEGLVIYIGVESGSKIIAVDDRTLQKFVHNVKDMLNNMELEP